MSELPDRLGERFVLGPMIGRGTCSRVYRAHDLLLDRAAAVKIFPVADDPRVQREVSLLASLDHPSLVGVYDVGQVDGRAFVVMALFEGGSLADRIARGPMALGETMLAVSAVADGLGHVHRSGVLHRDVTPRNVLFDADGRAHLSDFGVAFVADAPRITQTGFVVGSAPYLSPEQVRGEEVGPAADVYSLGLVMIEALTARPPYPGPPLDAALARLERTPVIPPGLGDDVAGLLTEMTADDPAGRPSADAVRLRLRRAALAREVHGSFSGPFPAVPGGRTVVPLRRRSPESEVPAMSAGGPVGVEPSRMPARALMVLGAAAMSIVLAGTVVAASTWTVRDASTNSSPPASLAPSASAPLALPAPPPPAYAHGDSTGGSQHESVAVVGSGSSDRAGAVPVARQPAAPVAGPRAQPGPDGPSSAGPTPRRAPTSTSAPSTSTPASPTSSREPSGRIAQILPDSTTKPDSTRKPAPTTKSDDTDTPQHSLLPQVGSPPPSGRSGSTTSSGPTTTSQTSRTTPSIGQGSGTAGSDDRSADGRSSTDGTDDTSAARATGAPSATGSTGTAPTTTARKPLLGSALQATGALTDGVVGP